MGNPRHGPGLGHQVGRDNPGRFSEVDVHQPGLKQGSAGFYQLFTLQPSSQHRNLNAQRNLVSPRPPPRRKPAGTCDGVPPASVEPGMGLSMPGPALLQRSPSALLKPFRALKPPQAKRGGCAGGRRSRGRPAGGAVESPTRGRGGDARARSCGRLRGSGRKGGGGLWSGGPAVGGGRR